MNEAEFDKFADEYYALHSAGIAFSGEGPEYFSEYKLKDIARKYGYSSQLQNSTVRILDFGAGIGNFVPYVHKYFASAELTCLDLSQRSLEIAEKRFSSQAQFVHFDGTRFPFPSDYFDIAFAMGVFHHIDHDEHISLLQELHRVFGQVGTCSYLSTTPTIR